MASSVRKHAYVLAGPYDPARVRLTDKERAARHALLGVNDGLQGALNACKDQISYLKERGRCWNDCKRNTNLYEYVFTSSPGVAMGIAAVSPTSRSYFKLWEMLHDFGGDMVPGPQGAQTAVFLAEGPGGFVEAFAAYRRKTAARVCERDVLHGMTLLQRNVPAWRVQSSPQLRLSRGADGTGDLYKVGNIDALVSQAGEQSASLVTADGGFDFSADYNGQEDASMRLILCETYAALRLQRLGGAFVLKVYDIHSFATMRILYGIRCCYAKVRIVKPLTSRPANSEKYVVATGFLGCAPDLLTAMREVCAACEAWSLWTGGQATYGRHVTTRVNQTLRTVLRVPVEFVEDIVRFNAFYIVRQALQITRAIVDEPPAPGLARHRQLAHAVRWCHAYGVPIALDVLRHHFVTAAAATAAATAGLEGATAEAAAAHPGP